MEESTGPINKRGPLTLINDFGLVRFGVSSPVSGEYAPMYFSRTCVNGTLTMTPIRKLKVWFESFVTIDGKEGAGLISETCEVRSSAMPPGTPLMIWPKFRLTSPNPPS
jgi:hypothetical protein